MKPLKRYWFTFEKFAERTPLSLGCGVTAHDYEDAVGLLREHVFKGKAEPTITNCVENVDIRSLDQGHVAPNIGSVVERGIWFPHGYHQR